MVGSAVSFLQHVADQFRQTSLLEWFGTITGFLCVYLAAKQHILNWPISILSVGAYAILFYQYGLFGDAFLQVYFFGTAVYGWYFWIRRKQEHQKPVASLSSREWGLTVGAILLLAVVLGLFLAHFTNSTVPYIDGFCTAMSFVAQFLMTRKVMQNWLLWIIVDICYIPLYLYKDLYLTALLYFVFLGPATLGYIDWRRSWKQAR
ncbi:nicotinamide riboside transporter PnuC [Hufsiella ginkgonis]|uniref:Nicotinamide riboside transporter PnuC n=1 Tax=Hufsiella ginkgonis TaxID=2695274 RepID=A0A7K1XV66_9SPHI|nr:nicotinamide riboside transporter PnuC [Hufsiella ginkgonis]MXV14870.1 nicotinamide riboside transporter PnuC [Hufsiella ginkgonis]